MTVLMMVRVVMIFASKTSLAGTVQVETNLNPQSAKKSAMMDC